MSAPTEWKKLPKVTYPTCDICGKKAIWSHWLGGLRCGKCPRPSAPTARDLQQVPDGSICTACEHSVADHDLQRATNLPPTLCRKCAIKGDICGGGVFRGPDTPRPRPSARELLRVGYEGEDVTPRLLILAARVDAVLALQPREWAGYDACLAEVRALLNGGQS
jgi:hypothetical protein